MTRFLIVHLLCLLVRQATGVHTKAGAWAATEAEARFIEQVGVHAGCTPACHRSCCLCWLFNTVKLQLHVTACDL